MVVGIYWVLILYTSSILYDGYYYHPILQLEKLRFREVQ